MGTIEFRFNKVIPPAELGAAIFRRLFLGRIKANKPCIVFIAGDSGEGKSETALKLGEIIAQAESTDIETFLTKQVIYTPFEYAEKFKWMMFSKEAKKKHILIFMEARELIKAKLWYDLINQSISDVNALSRTIKPIIFILTSQDTDDIIKDVRKTINYYGWVSRPAGEHVRLSLYKLWKNRFIENPKTRQKTLKGLVRQPDGSFKSIEISRFFITRPSKELRDRFKILDRKAKTDIILKKLEVMQMIIEREKPKFTKLEQLVETVMREQSLMNYVVKRTRAGGIKVRPEFKELYGLSVQELKEFQKILLNKLTARGLMAQEQPVMPDLEELLEKHQESEASVDTREQVQV